MSDVYLICNESFTESQIVVVDREMKTLSIEVLKGWTGLENEEKRSITAT